VADIVRTFRIPSGLEASRRRQVEAACGALQARQHAFAAGAPAAAAAREVSLDDASLRLVYRIDGGRPLLAEAPTTDNTQLLDWARQLCTVLASAYPAGRAPVLRHGGLCRENVLLDAQRRVRVLDFGVAECVAAALEPNDDTWLRGVAATAAPELWTQPAAGGRHSEIFAAGVLLHELATGVHPFGARAEDPEDCKFRALTELAAPPQIRNPALDGKIAAVIQRMLQRDAHERYATFEALLADLSLSAPAPAVRPGPAAAAPAAAAPAVTPSPPAAARDAAGLEEERRRYLQEQERLKQQREQADLRQAQRRRQRQAAVASIRAFCSRHAKALALSTGAGIALLVLLTGLLIRAAHHASFQRAVTQTNEHLAERFASGDGHLLALALDLSPGRKLVSAFEDLHKVAPGTVLALGAPRYAGLLHNRASATLPIGQSGLEIPLSLDPAAASGVRLGADPDRLAELLIEASDRLALEQLPPAVHELAQTLRRALSSATTASQTADILRQQTAPPIRDPLGYLAAHGDHAVLVLGAFRPLAGETGLRAEAALTNVAGHDVLQEPAEVRLRLAPPAAADGRWSIGAVQVLPEQEPVAHKLWCMNTTLDELRAAFEARDSARLAELTRPDDLAQIQSMLEWTQRCRQASLAFEPVQVADSRVQLTVQFDSGVAGGSPRHSAPLTLEFDGGRGWRIRADRANPWPPAPAALRRLELSADLVERFKGAWAQRSSALYLTLFEKHRLSPQAVDAMFEQMGLDNVPYDIEAREDPDDDSRLLIEVRPQADAQQARRGHVSKTFGFEMSGDALRWDGREDPLWVFAGRQFEILVRRLRSAHWPGLTDIEKDFSRTAARDMSVLERDKIERWIAGLREARDLFEPLSEEHLAGFPLRAALRGSGDRQLPFRLVAVPGTDNRVVYMLERELQRDDLGSAAPGAGSRWETLVGSPPSGQVVGLGFDEARDVARGFGCTLPDLDEWLAAARAAGDTPEQPGAQAFYGGVWEFCDEASPGGGHPLVVGGCWYDFDAQLLEAGLPRPPIRRLEARLERFGTVGFRLCKRFSVPPEALQEAE
jgi:hypothetical protein